jgi:hypothetical protein
VAPEPVWALWRKGQFLAPAGSRTPAFQIVAHLLVTFYKAIEVLIIVMTRFYQAFSIAAIAGHYPIGMAIVYWTNVQTISGLMPAIIIENRIPWDCQNNVY